jgi:hypothetical protein
VPYDVENTVLVTLRVNIKAKNVECVYLLNFLE